MYVTEHETTELNSRPYLFYSWGRFDLEFYTEFILVRDKLNRVEYKLLPSYVEMIPFSISVDRKY